VTASYAVASPRLKNLRFFVPPNHSTPGTDGGKGSRPSPLPRKLPRYKALWELWIDRRNFPFDPCSSATCLPSSRAVILHIRISGDISPVGGLRRLPQIEGWSLKEEAVGEPESIESRRILPAVGRRAQT